MAADVLKQVRCFQMTLTTTDQAAFLGGVKKIMLRSSADCYIDIDQPVAPTQSYKLLAANTADTTIELEMGLITQLHAASVTGGATLYVIAIAG